MELNWEEVRKVKFDSTMLFGSGYDFGGLELLFQEADTQAGRFIIWPDHIAQPSKWNVYGGRMAHYIQDLPSENAAKEKVSELVSRLAPTDN